MGGGPCVDEGQLYFEKEMEVAGVTNYRRDQDAGLAYGHYVPIGSDVEAPRWARVRLIPIMPTSRTRGWWLSFAGCGEMGWNVRTKYDTIG